jgi:putative heme-binding domain-containing protein
LRAAEVLSRSRLSEPQLLAFLELVRGEPLVSPGLLFPALKAVPAGSAERVIDYLEQAVRDGFRPRREDLAGLLGALPVAFRERSSRLLDQLENAPQIDRARLKELEPLLAGGDPRRGREVFFGKRAPCSACHRVGSEGGQVGPDLSRIGAVRSGRDLLESIVVPSSTFAQGYETYAVLSADGRISSGTVASQTPEGIVLRDASGAEQAFRKEKIRSFERQPTSLMPEGLDRALSAEDLRDLLSFLMSLR